MSESSPLGPDDLVAEKGITEEYFQAEMLRKLQEPEEPALKRMLSDEFKAIFRQGRHLRQPESSPPDPVPELEAKESTLDTATFKLLCAGEYMPSGAWMPKEECSHERKDPKDQEFRQLTHRYQAKEFVRNGKYVYPVSRSSKDQPSEDHEAVLPDYDEVD